MRFEVKGCSLEEFLKAIRTIERQSHTFSSIVFNKGRKQDKNQAWFEPEKTKLDHNVQQSGKKIFTLEKKSEKPTEGYEKDPKKDPARNIPAGNYYLQFYFHSKKGREVVGCVDLKWNENGKMTHSGFHPLFVFQKSFDRVMADSDSRKRNGTRCGFRLPPSLASLK